MRINRFTELNPAKDTKRLTIDLSVILADVEYVLYNVFWHQGQSRNSGHYGILVNENCTLYWNNYNDAKVTRVRSAMYSSSTYSNVNQERFGMLSKLSGGYTSANALVYIKKSEISSIFHIQGIANSIKTGVQMQTRKRKITAIFDSVSESDVDVQSIEYEEELRPKKGNHGFQPDKPFLM